MKLIIRLLTILPSTVFAYSMSMPHMVIHQNMQNAVLLTTVASTNNNYSRHEREREDRYQAWLKTHAVNPQIPCNLESTYCVNQSKNKGYFK